MLRDVRVTALETRPKSSAPLVMLTAYDFASARIAEAAGIDLVLVGDSAAITVLGYQSTREILVDELLVLTRAVRRGLRKPLLVGDLPYGTYESSDRQAVATAELFRHAGCDLVKLEGAGPMLPRVRAIIASGVPVMGHVGLLPQGAMSPEELRAKGRSAEEAVAIVNDAVSLADAGCSAIIVEAVPSPVGAAIATRVPVPVIGIGAGHEVDGQVLVYHDLLGLIDGRVPRFVRPYAELRQSAVDAIGAFAHDVRKRVFPVPAEEYGMAADEAEAFVRQLSRLAEPA